jgi:hypothetical protein
LRVAIEWRQRQGKEFADLVDQAEPVVARLRTYEHFVLSEAVSAQFLQVAGEQSKANEAWENVLYRGKASWKWAALGALYQESQSVRELVDLAERLDNSPNDHWTNAGISCLKADLPMKRVELLEEFQTFQEHRDNNFCDRYVWLYVPLLLGETQIAQQAAQEWIDEYDSGRYTGLDTTSVYAEEELIRVIATETARDTDSQNRLSRSLSHIMLGLLAISRGQRNLAIDHLEIAVERPYVSVDQQWAVAFLWHLKNDAQWPRGNPRMAKQNGEFK